MGRREPKPVFKGGDQVQMKPRRGKVLAVANTLGRHGELTCVYIVELEDCRVMYFYADEIERAKEPKDHKDNQKRRQARGD